METEDRIKELERRIELKMQLIEITVYEIADIKVALEHYKQEEMIFGCNNDVTEL